MMARGVNDPRPGMMACFARGYVLASWLYYESDEQSPWTDHEFDCCVGFLETWRHLWPAEFAARVGPDADLKTEAHALEHTAEEKAAALAWLASGKHWPAVEPVDVVACEPARPAIVSPAPTPATWLQGELF